MHRDRIAASSGLSLVGLTAVPVALSLAKLILFPSRVYTSGNRHCGHAPSTDRTM